MNGLNIARCSEHDTIIEFRPLRSWRGEFGFDWMRVYEGDFFKINDEEIIEETEISKTIHERKQGQILTSFPQQKDVSISTDGIETTTEETTEKAFSEKDKATNKITAMYERKVKLIRKFGYFREAMKITGSNEEAYIDGASGAAGFYTYHPYTLKPDNTNATFQDYPTPTIDPGRGLLDGGFAYDEDKKIFVDMNDGQGNAESAKDAKKKIAQPHAGGRGLQNQGGEYKIIRLTRERTMTYRLDKYFIPYLNLFPEPAAVPYAANPLLDGLPAGITLPTPCCEAELQVLYDIKNALPTRIWIEYEPTYLQITGKGISVTKKGDAQFKEFEFDMGQFKSRTPETYQDSVQAAGTIKIKCLKDIDNPNGMTLYVRAEQLGCRPEDGGSIVGALKICPNGANHRARLKVAFVEVRTNIMNVMDTSTGLPVAVTGRIRDCTGIVELFHGMHQALIVPDLINKETATGTHYVLDLTNVPAFRHLSTKGSDTRPDWGKLIEINPNPQPAQLPEGTKRIPNEQLAWNHGDFKKALKEEFKRQNPGPQAGGRILIFALGTEVFVKFDARSELGGICMWEPGSQVDLGGYKIRSLNTLANVCLFKDGGTGSALAHEILHALSLQHTHRERWTPPNITSNRTEINGFRYIFPFETTTNIMSYNPAVRHSTWHWQWEVMQDFLRTHQNQGE